MLYESSIIQLITIQPITIQHEYPKFSDVLWNTVQLPLLKPNMNNVWMLPAESTYLNAKYCEKNQLTRII